MGAIVPNREYQDLGELRRDVQRLIRQGRYRLTIHARSSHPEIPPEAKVAAVLLGGADRPNRNAAAGRPSYACWYSHPHYGLLRALYAIVEPPSGGEVVIISAFQE